jgi:hypothetical protein
MHGDVFVSLGLDIGSVIDGSGAPDNAKRNPWQTAGDLLLSKN